MKIPKIPSKELLSRQLFLTLPIPVSVNHCYITTRFGNKKILTTKAKKWFKQARQILVKEIQAQRWEYTQQVKIIAECCVYWQDLRTRDSSNLEKTLSDSLQDYVLDDDCYLLIRWIDWKIDRQNPRLEMRIRAFNPQIDDWEMYKKGRR